MVTIELLFSNIFMKTCPQKVLFSQILTICGSKTDMMTCHFLYVFLLRALCRYSRQKLVKIKLGNSDLYQFWVKNLYLEFLDFAQ